MTLTVEAWRFKMEAWRLKMETCKLKMELWRVYRPVVTDSHHIEDELVSGPDPHFREKLDPDLH
jgi:hypothetical protein